MQELELKEQANGDKKRSSQSTRAGGHIDSQLSTQATDKESTSSKENLITTPKKNKFGAYTAIEYMGGPAMIFRMGRTDV